MDLPALSGAQRTRLRGIGQRLPDSIRLGKLGLTAAFLVEFERALAGNELVKLRFEGADRDERERLRTELAERASCACVGSVGHTALFWRPGPTGSRYLES